MAKKAKAKKRVRQNWCSMVIRVAVPIKDIKKGMKVSQVFGRDPKGWAYDLEILNAYYDYKDQPSAF